MALPDYAAISTGTAIIFADSTHSPAANYNLGTRTIQIDCTDLAAGAARESVKFDFGVSWDVEMVLASCVEWEPRRKSQRATGLIFISGTVTAQRLPSAIPQT